jgi:hypothetical protein
MPKNETATLNVRQHHIVEPGGRGGIEGHTVYGLTASEDSYAFAIVLNCSNIHYLLRVIFGSHFSTFSYILHKMVYKY